jgi:WD40 repeat protein/tetratricopeptide (TPR) repeat protein
LKVLERLASCGYRMFLDSEPEYGIKAGQEWEKELYHNLNQASAVVVLCSDNLLASRWCFFEIASARALGKPIFAVIVSPCEVLELLKDRQVVNLAAEGELALQRLLDGLRTAGLDPNDSLDWDPRRPPYPGLNYFTEDDAGVFFGRDDEVRQVLEALETMQRRRMPRLSLLLGASGSGKSSLMRAGVLPRLKKDPARWVIVPPFRPGPEPIGELAKSLTRAFPAVSGRPDWKDVRDRLRAAAKADQPPSPDLLTELADDLTQAFYRREAAILLTIDQAEEALTEGEGPSTDFLRLVRRAAESPGSNLFALLTLRSDYLGAFQNHPALAGLQYTNLSLGPMAVEGFPRVIEGPARRAGIELADGLVAEMVADTRTDHALPLLAFTLRAMYDRTAAPRRFTHALYRDDLEGIQGAVAVVVKQIKARVSLAPGSAAEADLRRAFLKLVRLDPDGNYVRKPAPWDALPEAARPILQEMIDARLLASKDEGPRRTVEVVHESLFRVWDDLVRWLDEKRELLLWRQGLQDELGAWKENGESQEYLLRGGRVAEARRMLQTDREEFGSDEVRFLEESIAEEDRRVVERQRLFRRVRVAAIVATALAVLALIAGGIAFDQRNRVLSANGELKTAKNKLETAKDQLETANNELKTALVESKRSAARLALNQAESLHADGRTDQALLLLTRGLELAPTQAEAPDDPATTELQRVLRTKLNSWKSRVPTIRDQLEHGSSVYVAAFGPGGKSILTAGADGTARLWDAATGRPFGAPMKHPSMIGAAALSPDGKVLATAGGNRMGRVIDEEMEQITKVKRPVDNTARLWDATTGRPIGEPLEHQQVVEAVAFSPDGKSILTGSADGTARLWDAATGRPIGQPMKHPHGVRAVAFSPDGRAILTGCGDIAGLVRNLPGRGDARLWSAATCEAMGQPLPHPGVVVCVGFSPSARTILTGIWGPNATLGQARLWDRVERRPIGKPLDHQGRIQAVAFSPDGKTALTGSSDSTARLWDAESGEPRGDAWKHDGPVVAVAFSPDGKTALTGSADHTARLWDASTGEPMGTPLRHAEGIWAVAFHPGGRTLITGCSDGAARIWQVPPAPPRGRSLPQLTKPGLLVSPAMNQLLTVNSVQHGNLVRGTVTSIAFSPDGKFSLVGGLSGLAHFWETATGQPLGVPLQLGSRVDSVAFSPVDKVAVTCADRAVRLWEVPTGRPIGKPFIHRSEVLCNAFSPDGKIVATATSEGIVGFWEVATGRYRLEVAIADRFITALALSPDGRLALAGIGKLPNGYGRFLDLDTGKARVQELRHQGLIRVVAFSPDGRMALTGSEDRTARLWEVATGRPLGEPLMHPHAVVTAAFSPDGKIIATGTGDALSGGPKPDVGFVRLWDVATGRPMSDPMPHRGRIAGLAFHSDGATVVAGAESLTEWDVPRPLDGGVEQLALWASTITGQVLDPTNALYPLDSRSWREHRDRLQALGGPPAGAAATAEEVAAELRHAAEESEEARQWFAAAWHLQRLLAANPGDGDLRRRRARADRELGWWEEAITDLTKAIEQHPDDGQLRNDRGVAYAELARWDAAAADFSKAMELTPEDLQFRFQLGLTYLAKGDLDGYRRFCQDFLEWCQKRNVTEASMMAAWACVLSPKAIPDPAAVVQLAEKVNKAILAKQSSMITLARVSNDPRLIQQATAAFEDIAPASTRVLGAALYRAGQLESAVRHLNDSVKSGKSLCNDLLFMAMAQHRLGRADEANQLLARAVQRIDQALDAGTFDGRPVTWENKLQAMILRREAEARIDAK